MVWQGTTDSQGRASFDIKFRKQNFTDEWILTTNAADIKMRKRINIFISNPVHINLGKEHDSLPYQPLMHVAPGDPFFPVGSRMNPYPSIQEAMDNMVTGIVYVHPGDYNGVIAPGADRGGIDLPDSIRVFGAGADVTHLHGSVNAEYANGAQLSGMHIEDGIHSIHSSLVLTNLLIHDFAGNAIWGTQSDFEIINNTIANNGQNAIFLHDSSTATIKNNIITGQSGLGVNRVESAQATIDFNNFWNNVDNYHEFFLPGENDQSQDPMYVDINIDDYQLQSSSPSIDAGDPDVRFNDLDGTRNDQGAFGGQYSRNQITPVFDPGSQHQTHLMINVHPNPASDFLQVEIQLARPKWIEMGLYNSFGQKMGTILRGLQLEGTHSHSFLLDQNINSGVYWLNVRTKFQHEIAKVMVFR
ncbi:MAG: right-handed parallel beta-helix repeat-containing protein [Saprospiraceae bacterium]|nr:right-handed parallel beta-helix repeat-containing protein [Saprospiraceae bacterium]